MDSASIYHALKYGTPEQRIAMIQSLPDDDFKSLAAGLMSSPNAGMAVVALVPLITRFCAGKDPAAGAALALAAHRYGVEVREAGIDPGLLLMTLSNVAASYMNALNLLGRSQEALEFGNQFIPYYERNSDPDDENDLNNLRSLKVARINAWLNLNNVDAAAKDLADPNLEGSFATDVEVTRLREKVAQLTGTIFVDKRDAKKADVSVAGTGPVAKAVQAAVEGAVRQSFGSPGQAEELIKALGDRFESAPPSDPSDPETFSRLMETLRRGESFLTGLTGKAGASGPGVVNEWTLKRRVREASGLFVLFKQPDPDAIRAALSDLQASLRLARAGGHREIENDALWGIYLCWSRLKEPSDAADALLSLRHNLEETRAAISDPTRRGGAFSAYPHLFDALCEKLYAAGRAEELLEAIEASKGRGIADLLTSRTGAAVSDESIYSAARRLPELTRRHQFHYVTFHVDDERTYVVVVTKDGRVRAVPPVPLGRAAVRNASLHVDPSHWGRRTPDTSRLLSPLIGWAEELLADGSLAPGDHVCYAADEDVSNVPLHYLLLHDEPLLESVTLSRIQNARHLAEVLDRPPAAPRAFVAFFVPAAQDVAGESWPIMKRALLRPPEWLDANLSGPTFADTSATIGRLRGLDLSGKLLHFSAHGVFGGAPGMTPFNDSGVVLAGENGLPDKDRIADGDRTDVLTPAKVLDLKLDLRGSHVSLMTCVSGLSREGIGGDALGPEWAFIHARAASLLASHWYVDAEMAAEVVERFYRHWINGRKSRGRALAETIRELQATSATHAERQSYAAFSLTGDWR